MDFISLSYSNIILLNIFFISFLIFSNFEFSLFSILLRKDDRELPILNASYFCLLSLNLPELEV